MPYDIGDALKRIEDILLGSIRRNMLRHVGEERREGFDWTMWQTEQLASIRRWSAANLKRHAKDFTRINNAAISLLQQSAVSAETQAEQTLLQTGIQKADEFFDIPDAKLDALLTATRQDLSSAEHALLRKADDVYRKAVFDANVYLQSGAGTMKDAVEMAVEDMRAKGIRAVTYRNGAQVEASSYARMALRTANVRARMAGEGRARDKAGIHTVLVPPSGIACRKCAPWMGRVLVDDVYCSGTAQEASALGVPLLSEAIAAGFLHPQCNCSPHMFLPGVSKMPEVTDEDRDEAVRRYDLTQRQRYNERQIRKWKTVERDAPDARTREKAAARRRSWQQANKTLCDAEPDVLRRDYSREKIYDLPDEPIVPEVIEKAEEPGEKAGERVRPGQSRTFADRPGQSETFGDARAEMPEQEAITIPPPDGNSQNYRPTITNPGDSVEIPRPSSPAAFRAETTQNVIYISENVTLKPKKLHQIDRRITEALRLIGMSGASVSPRIVVVSREDMGNSDPGSYRAVEDLLLLCEDTAVYSPDSVPELMAQLACGDNDLSTYIHELYHWREAVRYRGSSGKITHEDYALYSQRINDRAKKALDILVEKGYNVIVSDYARRSAIKGLFDEVFTEYRTYQALGGDRDA